ncbi:F-box-like domain protein [Ceratobasidium sp. AG-Ba]|nr:F-box-like domain protein [Ceratobasidium sp. AG-Ba]
MLESVNNWIDRHVTPYVLGYMLGRLVVTFWDEECVDQVDLETWFLLILSYFSWIILSCFIAVVLFELYLCYAQSQRRSKPTLSSLTGPPRLPAELVWEILDILASHDPKSTNTSSNDEDILGQPAKPNFEDFRALSCANRRMRSITLASWFRTLYIRKVEDWDLLPQSVTCGYVRELRILEDATRIHRSEQFLAIFSRIHTVVIDVHGNFGFHDPANNLVKRGFLAPCFIWPKTLRRLCILNLHPDRELIHHISSLYPFLEELEITRCTMFNKVTSKSGKLCGYWDRNLAGHRDYLYDLQAS